MTALRVLHVLDHSVPLHSGYSFRTLSILREQRKLGWQTFHVTSPKQVDCSVDEETVDGWHFFRTQPAKPVPALPGLNELALINATERRLLEVARQVRPHLLHAHSPVLNAIPALRVGRRLGIPVVYEVRAFWEDAAVDHGTTQEGSLRYRLTRWLETRALRQAQHVFTICEGLRNDIVGRGIAANRITVIPNAVDIAAFDPGGQPDTFTVDHWRCRFVADTGEGNEVSHAQIVSLLQRFDANGLDVIKTENLYNFDGAKGYSA